MKRSNVATAVKMSVLVASLGIATATPDALAAKSKGKGKAGAKAAPAKEKAPPPANAEEIGKLKGTFTWGMNLDEVAKKIEIVIQESYAETLKKTAADPTANDRARKQMAKEIKDVKKGYVKFDGQTSGYDVSIIDQEFAHKTGESMLAAKENNATRYFFFSDGRLYKMFIAFDKQLVQDKSFDEFGELMQARFGKGKAVEVEFVRKEQKFKVLSHYEWKAASGDGLHLVDRSAFYDVYCLVVFNDKDEKRLAEIRKLHPKGEKREALVEAVVNADRGGEDANADIIDRITGQSHGKVSEAPADIAVPSTTTGLAPSAADVNRKESAPASAPPSAKRKTKSDTDGLEL